jgi:hypothetical protein
MKTSAKRSGLVLRSDRERRRRERGVDRAVAVPQLRRGYGLPCAQCRTYYAADQTVCPVCRATERVSPNAASPVAVVNEPAPEYCGDNKVLEAAREHLVREFALSARAQCPGKIAKLEDVDLRQYDRRRDRIEELRKDLERSSH